MSIERCDNYDICEKYTLYGKCEHECNDGMPSLSSFCNAHEKQIIKTLSSIDEKLEKLLDTKMEA